ncbi:unnamed protein product [Aphanomyces euteiches]|nr:hypothetical protein AeRB84_020440 [Aphanomyces euteiches]
MVREAIVISGNSLAAEIDGMYPKTRTPKKFANAMDANQSSNAGSVYSKTPRKHHKDINGKCHFQIDSVVSKLLSFVMAAIPKEMRAVGFTAPLPIDNPDSLVDIIADVPTVSGHKLLVQVKAIGVNPADFKIRLMSLAVEEAQRLYTGDHKTPKILGYDAAGAVVAVGPDVSLFKVGDEVFYAGGMIGQGSNAEYQAVDERIVGRKPASLSFTDAAALPMSSVTAYEAIFDRLGIARKDSSVNNPMKKSVLILNGAGGVGSMAIQLLKALTDLTVIASASRIDCMDIPKQLAAIGMPQVDFILAFTELPQYFDTLVEAIKPQGKIGSTNPFMENLPFQKLFAKSVTFAFVSMGTRPIHRLLNHVSELVDAKRIRTTVRENLGTINAATLRKAHATLEAGRVVGKLVLSGY